MGPDWRRKAARLVTYCWRKVLRSHRNPPRIPSRFTIGLRMPESRAVLRAAVSGRRPSIFRLSVLRLAVAVSKPLSFNDNIDIFFL
jgi:hypothetical protein